MNLHMRKKHGPPKLDAQAQNLYNGDDRIFTKEDIVLSRLETLLYKSNAL